MRVLYTWEKKTGEKENWERRQVDASFGKNCRLNVFYQNSDTEKLRQIEMKNYNYKKFGKKLESNLYEYMNIIKDN